MNKLSEYNDCRSISHACSENRRRFEIDATESERKNIIRTKIDGCVFDSKDLNKKCDYIFEYKDYFSCFVELKGKNVKAAVKQLEKSLSSIDISGKKYAFIIASKVDIPNISAWKRKAEKDFSRKFSAELEAKTGELIKKINKNRLI